ncbi:MAG: phage capsid protein [Methylococcaceae bacterium]
MSSLTYNPSLDQGAAQNFRDSFLELAQQTESRLKASGVLIFLSSKGKTNHMARIGRIELVEVNTRNPDKQIGDYNLDNRQFTKRRFTKTIQIDAKYDINELLKDPTSDILKQLNNAKERQIDRITIAAAVGAVLVGDPAAAPTSRTAAQDGVVTVDASAGVTYEKIQEITENFINNELDYSMFRGSVLCIAGEENTNLMAEVEFINSDYISGKPVEDGVLTSAGTYRIELFAGSKSGGITVTNPIIPEGATLRSCVALAPESVAMAIEIGEMGVEKSSAKVNSFDLTIDLWINAMRTEGVRVQLLSTTI